MNDRATGDQGSAQGPGRVAVAAVVGCTLLVTLLVSWAALIGPGQVLDGEGPGRVGVTGARSEMTPPDPGPSREKLQDGENREAPLIVSILAVGLVVLAMLVLLAGLAAAIRFLWRLRPRASEHAVQVEFDVVEAPARVAEAIIADAAAQRTALLEGSPRNGIVQCWHRFETQAAGVGMPRRAWETSSEHALRILELAEADQVAVSRLSALFREARFSGHEVTEESRRQAVVALEDLHTSLGGWVRG